MEPQIRALILVDSDEAEEDDLIPPTSEPLLGSSSDDSDRNLPPHGLRRSSVSKQKLLLYAGPALLLCTFVVGFDISFLSTNYSRRIASNLHDLNNAGWIILAGSISESACQPIHGHISQLYGRRIATLIASAAMAFGLLLCSLSHRLWQLSLARVVVGTGSSGLQLLVVVVINDLVKLQDLPLWKSTVVVTETFALMLGGPVSSVLADWLGWRQTFALEFLFMLLSYALVYLTLHPPPPTPKHSAPTIAPASSNLKNIDFLGSISLFIAVATPLFAINIGGNILPWPHPLEILLLCLTPLGIALFYYFESRHASFPIIPTRFIRMRSVVAVICCAFPVVFAFNQLIYNFALYVETRSLHTPSKFNDWALSCVYVGRPIGAVIAGLLIRWYLKFKPLLQVNLVVSVGIYFLVSAGWIHAENPAFVPFLVIIGFNLGISEGCLLVSLLSIVDKADQSQLYAFFSLTIAIAGDLGIAVSLALTRAFIKWRLSSTLGDSETTDELIRKSLDSLDYVRSLPPAEGAIVAEAFISSIEKVFGLSGVALCFSILAAYFMVEMPGT
ncbi:major facilitator superfamily domain-containing protein [Cadophora sp. MPI-SDFR-AT-0126]|nr:major facilitator superfamily domain-containing protein [Leotiomycetes sp. MPI-SDFR-AT-0126]